MVVIISDVIAFSNSNNNTILDARNFNTTDDLIPTLLTSPSTTWRCGRREGKYMMLAMVLIEDLSTSLMLTEDCQKNSFNPVAAFASAGTLHQLQLLKSKPVMVMAMAMAITK